MNVLLNLCLGLIALEFAAIFGAFPTMIENARRAGRDLHTYSIRQLLNGGDVTQVLDFIEGHYCHNRVLLLRLARVTLVVVAFTAMCFLGTGTYVATNHVNHAKGTLVGAGLELEKAIAIEAAFMEIPQAQYVVALCLEFLILLALGALIIKTEFPHDIKTLLNPPRCS